MFKRRVANIVVLLAVSATPIVAGVPAQDARNTKIVGTDTHFGSFEFKSRVQWEKRKAYLKEQILSAAGLVPMPPKNPLRPHIFGRIERKGYSIEKVYIESFPGYYLCGNLFRPLHAQSSSPGILVAHGHFTYGRLENEPLYSGPVLGANLAEQGYVVFAYDMVGYNDTSQTSHSFGGPYERLWSFSPLGLQLWNSIRALDFLESLPGVDPQRIAMTGASGGGTQTFLLTAVDERVRYSAVVNMVSAEMQGGDICENAPGLRFDTYNVEIAAMMAPRPMFLVSTSGDWTHNTPALEYPTIKKIYDLYDKGAFVGNAHFHFPHNYNHDSRMAVYAFFRKYLSPSVTGPEIVEDEDEPEQLQDMLVFYGRSLPQEAKTYDQLFEFWRRMSADEVRELPVETLKSELTRVLGVEWPEHVESELHGDNVVLSRADRGDRVPGVWVNGRNPVVLVVDPNGSKSALQSDSVRTLRSKGNSVLCIDAFQTGAAKAPRGKLGEYFLTFNRSDDMSRVQDILTAIAFLKAKTGAEIHVEGIGRAAIWCLFAAAVSPVHVQLDSRIEGFSGTDDEMLRQFPVPGIQKVGGVQTAMAIFAKRSVSKSDGRVRAHHRMSHAVVQYNEYSAAD